MKLEFIVRLHKNELNLKSGQIFLMKKLFLISFLFPVFAFANSTGIGEYRFGPETAENAACEYADHRAKEAAILKFFGEQIESIQREECVNTDCEFHDEIFRDVKGIIKKIISRQLEVVEEKGHRKCVVKIAAEVAPVENSLKFKVEGKLNYVEGETVNFFAITNKPGIVAFFSYHENNYHTVYATKIEQPDIEQKLSPRNKNIVAQVEGNNFQTKELIAFLFTDYPIELKLKYTPIEMKNMLESIPATKRQVLYRYVTIVRKR